MSGSRMNRRAIAFLWLFHAAVVLMHKAGQHINIGAYTSHGAGSFGLKPSPPATNSASRVSLRSSFGQDGSAVVDPSQAQDLNVRVLSSLLLGGYVGAFVTTIPLLGIPIVSAVGMSFIMTHLRQLGAAAPSFPWEPLGTPQNQPLPWEPFGAPKGPHVWQAPEVEAGCLTYRAPEAPMHWQQDLARPVTATWAINKPSVYHGASQVWMQDPPLGSYGVGEATAYAGEATMGPFDLFDTGQAVAVLRSDNTWSRGTVAGIQDSMIVVSIDGTTKRKKISASRVQSFVRSLA